MVLRPRRMKFVIAPMGSAGDVHPLLALAKLLQQRGHDVVMVVQAVVAEMAEKSGIRTISIGDKAQQESVLKDADLWHPKRAFALVARLMPQAAEETLPVLKS